MEIEDKYRELIDISIKYMTNIEDNEHNINHINDVVRYTKELINAINIDINKDVCIISAYWHDVGRFQTDIGHEKLSAEMLKKYMMNMNYDNEFIHNCYQAIEKHKWNMTPLTNEGLILKDADKLAFLGKGRWKACLENDQNLDSIIDLLPKLRNEILYFEESRKIYDREIVELLKLLYKKEYNKGSDK